MGSLVGTSSGCTSFTSSGSTSGTSSGCTFGISQVVISVPVPVLVSGCPPGTSGCTSGNIFDCTSGILPYTESVSCRLQVCSIGLEKNICVSGKFSKIFWVGR